MACVDPRAVHTGLVEMQREDVRAITINVPVYVPERGLARSWPAGHELHIRASESDVVIEGDKIALRALGTLLLALSEPDMPPSMHFHLDPAGELTGDSASLTLDHDEWDEPTAQQVSG